MDLFAALERDKPEPAPAKKPGAAPRATREVRPGMAALGGDLPAPLASIAAPSDRTQRRPVIGAKMIYRSMYRGGDFDAVVTCVRYPGLQGECVDLDVFNDNGTPLIHVTRIPISAKPIGDDASAYFGDRPKR